MCTRNVFWAKHPQTCAKYAFHKVAKGNAVNDESFVRILQQNFYKDDILKSVRTPQEAVEIKQKFRDILINVGCNLTKWITNDDEVKSQIPETDRSTKVLNSIEAEPQSSSILGLSGMWIQTVSLSVLELSKNFQQK